MKESKKEYRDRIHLVTRLTAALLTRNETTLRLGKRETTEAVIRKACEIYDDILDRCSVIDHAKNDVVRAAGDFVDVAAKVKDKQ